MLRNLGSHVADISLHVLYTGTVDIAAEVQRAPLPPFDDTVRSRLKKGEAELVWNAMLRQAAAYYHGNWPDMDDSHVYRVIGQKMVAEFPAIQQEGPNSWVSLGTHRFDNVIINR